MPWCSLTSGERLWYEEAGEGDCLILLHGWSMSSDIWKFQLESLSRHFHVIAPDLRGHGRSDKCQSGYSFDAFAADVALLVEKSGARRVVLLGWSMGAEIALLASRLLGEQLRGLVLVSGTPCFSARDGFPYALPKVEADGMALKVRRNAVRALEGFKSQMFAEGELETCAAADSIREMLAGLKCPDRDVALASLATLSDGDLRGMLHEVAVPALVVNGDMDRICLPEASAYLHANLCNSVHRQFSGCGHALFLSRKDEFDTCIIDFCRRSLERC